MELSEEQYLAHYGTPRRSGRYPWGSGGDAVAPNSRSFLDMIKELLGKGMSEKEIAEGFGMSTTDLRAARSIAKNEQKQSDIAMAQALKEKGWSNVAIGERMGMPESTVRTLLAPGAKEKADVIQATAALLKKEMDKNPDSFLDVGTGTEMYLGVSPERLKVALAVLKQEGYEVHTNIKVKQLGTQFETNYRVLAPPGTKWAEVRNNIDKIRQFNEKLDDTGKTSLGMLPPIPINPKRVGIVYGPDGGSKADGVMYVRPGVEDVSLGGSRYAQVRVQVGKNHYLKGMAMYKDDLPDGVDILFNTNKTDTGNKLDALKELSDDPDNPFGAQIRSQVTKLDSKGKPKNTSVMNLVNEEGSWTKWSKSIASQVLSKQSPRLAREQLDMAYEQRANELDQIMKLTNPTVRRKLLEDFAGGADAAAVHLKAANLPRQGWHAILPISSMKPGEIYAPNYDNGERVALIRYPHGGTFEIPELVVNNRHREASSLLKGAKDAVGIHHSVAERLSGADFDGDTVLVIPNNSGRIKSSPALDGLKNFDPKTAYPAYPGMKRMSNTQTQMGVISNLITDMTIQKASQSEIARAVRHSMVVIDAEKHNLNYKESARRENIKQLQEKYQTKADGTGGASTIVSRAKSRADILDRKPRPQSEGGPIDKDTGALVFVPTGRTNYRTGEPIKVTKKALEVTDDAHTLSSGTPIERLYANHSNRLKAMANQARLDAINTPRAQRSPSAAKTYENEVRVLDAKLTLAKQNAPLERRAQLLANTIMKQKKDDNPTMDPVTEKKLRYQALDEARNRTGAKKQRIEITPKEWEAIQAGAISDSKLRSILDNADMDLVKELATPRNALKMTNAKTSRAQSMLAAGYDRAEVARQLGVSLSTLDRAMGGGD